MRAILAPPDDVWKIDPPSCVQLAPPSVERSTPQP
jgi:hypothetical protein